MKERAGEGFVLNTLEAQPLVWTNASGCMKNYFAHQWVVIIALEHLDRYNGLPLLADCKQLECGEYVILSGDEEMNFEDKGGGLAFIIRMQM